MMYYGNKEDDLEEKNSMMKFIIVLLTVAVVIMANIIRVKENEIKDLKASIEKFDKAVMMQNEHRI